VTPGSNPEARREFGLGLQTDKRPGEYAALARVAEAAGFDVVTTFNDLYYQPALPALLEIAAATERVRVGPSCLNPYTAHPVEIAGQIAALDLASQGRAFVGLAAGAWLDELRVAQSRPLATVREAWAVVSRLLAGDRSGFEGDVFRLEPGRGLEYATERDAVPLLVGSWSPRLMAFAGEQRAELKIGGSANPAMVRLARERAPGARVVVGAVTVVDRDGDRARAVAREHVAMYVDVVRGLDPTVEGEAPLELFAFAGTPDEIRAQADELFEAGATRVEFGTPHGVEPHAAIELLGSVIAR
jgi:5,10-methylenetetrahydromethanopterin reductase